MATSIPAKLKTADISRFAMRAAQLKEAKPVVAYWLNMYIVNHLIGLGLHTADDECKLYTTQLMDNLEATKAAYPNDDSVHDDVAAQAYCEQFALEIFGKADNAIRNNRATAQTADTFRAAATFLDLLSFWNNPPSAEITAKSKFAKYHALRIAKALKAGEDPNLTNPVQEPPPAVTSPSALDPNDPDVQRINGDAGEDGTTAQAPTPFQPYAESAPNTSSAHPSPSRISPPPMLPSAPSGYAASSQITSPPTFQPHRDVSPMSQPTGSRQGSVSSVGGGYFPRTPAPVPTFTAEPGIPSLPTAPSADEDMAVDSVGGGMTATAGPTIGSDPSSFYQNPAPQLQPPPQQPHFPSPQQPQPPPPQNIFDQQIASPPAAPIPHHAQPAAPPQSTQANTFDPMAGVMATNGVYNTDEEAILKAQKHAKWAVSALNFEDVETAVSELRIALRALGAS